MELKNHLLNVRKGLDCCLRIGELLGMFYKWLPHQQQKGNYKMCTSQHAFKDTLHCAHIPFNVVPKGAQPLAQSKSLGEAEAVWRKRRGAWGVGVGGGAVKGESSLPVKDQPSV